MRRSLALTAVESGSEMELGLGARQLLERLKRGLTLRGHRCWTRRTSSALIILTSSPQVASNFGLRIIKLVDSIFS